jgi:hypothetical protein
MTYSRLVLALLLGGATTLAAQAKPLPAPKPLTATELTLAYARAMPFKSFLATDTTKAALWAAAEERTAATVAAVIKDTPPPAGVWHLLVVAENSCNDALASLPYLARLVEQMPGSELRVLRKVDAEPLLNAHLFNGRAATPLVLVLDAQFKERGAWVERASHIQNYVVANEGKMPDDTLWAKVRVMRKEDDGRTPVREVIAIMKNGQKALAKQAPAKGKKAVKIIEPCKLP